MTTLDRLDADDLRQVMVTYRDALKEHRDVINRLNVYPVPDGDTGTNMGLTLDSVVSTLEETGPSLPEVCRAISHGSLMGARGNSGVILSQVLRGISAVVAEASGADGTDAPTLARALGSAAEAAYQAVMTPVEGTILTVVRESSAVAERTAADSAALVDVLAAARAEAAASLERTPTLLPVLAEAGVVDAGGAGYVLLLDALLAVVDGRAVPAPDVTLPAGEGPLSDDTVLHHADHEAHDVSETRYEVMFFLDAPDDAVDGFKQTWATIGDSIVVVGGDGIWNCHVHTDDIGAAIEAGIAVGRPHKIRVTDLHDEVAEEAQVRSVSDEGLLIDSSEPVPTAVVAVAAGRGAIKILRSLGVRGIVVGGQTMNPSTAQLLEAVERVPADQVVILPNNKNIVPVAEQVDAQTAKVVRVVPTTSIVEGFTALISYDPEAPADDNAGSMLDAIDAVITGEVTRAVRDSTCEVGPISEGDHIGIGPRGIQAVAPTVAQAAVDLLEALVGDEHEIVTLIEGEDATAADTRAISDWLEEHRPEVALELHQGHQPLYPYLFGIE
jgi:uncharacterized protein